MRNVTADTRANGGVARLGLSAQGYPGEVLEYCIDTKNVGGADLPNYA
ncbi:hypothetical protein [Deinococcus hopiensis]|nr:hypothetical protein [Deinococcus hopiensis]